MPPRLIVATSCPNCRTKTGADDLTCPMCGTLLKKQRDLPPTPPAFGASPQVITDDELPEEPERILGMPAPIACLLLGAVIAPVFGLTPILQYASWFLGSLVHEMGHCLFGLLLGNPMIPAIRIDGHAVSFYGCPPPGIWAWITGLAYPFAAWHFRQHRAVLIACSVMTLLYPLCIFTRGRDLVILLGGHLGEAMFATIALYRAITGGSTHHRAERICYAVVGFELVRRNVSLCWGLVTSPIARDHYANNGSLGLTNDMIRVAEDVLFTPLPRVGLLMLVVALAVLPVAAGLAWWRMRRGDDEA